MKTITNWLVCAVLLVVAVSFAAKVFAMPAEEAHGLCYGYAAVTLEAAKARDRGVTREEALGVVLGEDDIYTELVVFVFDNPTARAIELATEVYKTCMTQLVTK